jgi:hypothetical protein
MRVLFKYENYNLDKEAYPVVELGLRNRGWLRPMKKDLNLNPMIPQITGGRP